MRKLTLVDRINAGIAVAGTLCTPFAVAFGFYQSGREQYAIEAGFIGFIICAGLCWMWWDAKKHTDGC